jgi:superfamily II DNA or RNA helicase
LKGIIGHNLLALVPENRSHSKPTLVSASEHLLRGAPERISELGLSRVLVRNFDPGKREELTARFRTAGLPTNDLGNLDAQDVLRRFLGLAGEAEASTVGLPTSENFKPKYGLFPHQRSVVRRIHAAIGRGRGRAVVHMPTGAGKTRTAMHYAARLLNEAEPCVIVWLASGRELLEQAADAFASAWDVLGNREVSLQRFWGDHDGDPTVLQDGILVAGFAKMQAWRARAPIEAMRLAAATHLVTVDEAHQAIAPTYRGVIEGIAEAGQRNAVLGLTATPGRTWSDVAADEELSEFFDRRKVVLEVDGYDNPVEYLLAEGYLARPSFEQLGYASPAVPSANMPSTDGDDYDDAMRDALARSTARNRAILDGVQRLVDRGHERIILFAASVDHARLLSAALELRGTSARVVTGDTPTARRAAILSEYRRPSSTPVVLCNFGVLTTGFDAPRTSAAVIARPTRSLVLFSQMVGRATRGPRAGGNAQSEILTVHDPTCPGFGDVAEAFFNWEDVWSE